MPRLDVYLRSLQRFGATALVLTSGQPVVLRFPAGDRHATQTTPHDQLVALVREIAGPAEWQSASTGRAASFTYRSESGPYRVEVLPQGPSWSITVEPGEAAMMAGGASAVAAAAAPPPVAPPPAAPPMPDSMSIESAGARAAAAPESDFMIERTSYEVPDDAAAIGTSSYLDDLLCKMKESGASDLHLCSGCPPIVRLHGEMQPIPGVETLSPERLLEELSAITPATNREEFAARSDTDFAYAIPKVSRFRVNMFMDRKGPGAVFRAIPFEMPDAGKLGIPAQVLELGNLTKGLVVVTGPTGSGKSTTLAALIDHINQTRSAHIITIEDPVEFVHPNKRCLVNQREIGVHTKSFKAALRAALREDPDIVLVGEMRDLETIAIAVETAETGHLVFGTLHTTTAPGTVDRIIDQFPSDRQEQVRTMLSESLKGVIAQVLCKRVGGGRCAAYEILLGSNAVSNLIRERKTFQLFSIMQTGRNQGMVTMNDSLIELVKAGKVEPLEAYMKSVNKSEMKTLLTRAGHEL